MLGVLTSRELDNGRGRARIRMFRHLHEIETGKTSSTSHDFLKFDKNVRYGMFQDIDNVLSNIRLILSHVLYAMLLQLGQLH